MVFAKPQMGPRLQDMLVECETSGNLCLCIYRERHTWEFFMGYFSPSH